MKIYLYFLKIQENIHLNKKEAAPFESCSGLQTAFTIGKFVIRMPKNRRTQLRQDCI